MYRIISVLVLAVCCRLCHTQSTNSSLSVSEDGSCGVATNQTCLGSTYGSCCSLKGFCGSTNDFCNPTAGCQSSFGSCSTNTSYISYDGKCGSTDPNKQVCVGSTFGSCCSQKGWCGDTADYCSIGCQSAFGTCGGTNITTETNTDGTPSSTAPATPSTSVISTSISAGGSSTSGANSVTPDISRSGSSQVGFEIAIGVLCGLLALLSVIIVVLLLKRRARPHPGQSAIPEKSDAMTTPCSCGGHSVMEAPSTHPDSTSSTLGSTYGSSKQQPVELGSTGYGRAELRESYIEIENHGKR